MPKQHDRKSQDEGEPGSGSQLRRWWQWLLVYPTLVIALGGHIPAAVDQISSWVRGGAPDKTVWTRNLVCVQDPDPKLIITTILHFNISVQPCAKTGDFWLRVTDLNGEDPTANTKYEWLTREEILKKTGFMSKFSVASVPSLTSSALAATPASSGMEVMRGIGAAGSGAMVPAQGAPATPVGLLCQFQPNATTLVRVYRLNTGACTEDVINLATGQLIRHGPAACQCH